MPVIPYPRKELNKKRVTLVASILSIYLILFIVGIIFRWEVVRMLFKDSIKLSNHKSTYKYHIQYIVTSNLKTK